MESTVKLENTISIAAVADRYGVSTEHIDYLTRSGKLQLISIGGRRPRITVESMREFEKHRIAEMNNKA